MVISVSKLYGSDEIHTLQAYFASVRPDVGTTEFASVRDINNRPVQSLLARALTVAQTINRDPLGADTVLQKIWFQKTNGVTPSGFSSDRTPFRPHIDTHRMRKAMIYVHGVEEQDGPLYSSHLDPNAFESGRVSASRRIESGASTPRKEWDELLANVSPESFRPVVGDAGSVHIFDTNTPHFAGTPVGERERSVIRLDFVERRTRWLSRTRRRKNPNNLNDRP